MREIKFRLWNGAAMEPVGTITFHTDRSYHVNDEYPVNDLAMDHQFGGNRYFLMQYTGLKDRLGKEIYEGDFVRSKAGDIYVVRYETLKSSLLVLHYRAAKHRKLRSQQRCSLPIG